MAIYGDRVYVYMSNVGHLGNFMRKDLYEISQAYGGLAEATWYDYIPEDEVIWIQLGRNQALS